MFVGSAHIIILGRCILDATEKKLRYALTGHFIVMLNYLDIEKSYYYVEKSVFF